MLSYGQESQVVLNINAILGRRGLSLVKAGKVNTQKRSHKTVRLANYKINGGVIEKWKN